MTRRSISRRTLAERSYPHRVDVPVPPLGLGRALTDMVDWCNETIGRGAWELHHRSEPRGRGVVPREWARFYFRGPADAEAFVQAWQGYLAPLPSP